MSTANTDPIRIGIIGCGSVTLAAHIPALLKLSDTVRVVAIADPTKPLRDKAQALLGLADADVYESHEALLERSDLDAVDVCTPPNIRVDIVRAAAAAGRHILCEKPLATVPQDAEEIVRITRDAGVLLGLVHNYLYRPEFVEATQLLARGDIGTPEVAILNYLGVLDNPGSAEYMPGWRRRSAVAGGGVLMDMMHVVYVAEHLLGEEIRRVSGYIDAREDGSPVEDLALCRFETDTKAALVNIGWGAGPGGVQLSGSLGRLTIHYELDGTSPFFPPRRIDVVGPDGTLSTVDIGEDLRDDHQLLLADFVEAVRDGREPIAPGEQGQRALEAVLAVYASAITERTIALPLSHDDPVWRLGAAGLAELAVASDGRAARRALFGVSAADASLIGRQGA
jgi:predicted dehydrogenase